MPGDEPSVETLARGVRDGDRGLLARAITLVESLREDHRARAQELLQELLPHTGGAHRIGVSGVPGVGKSTFLEAFGLRLLEEGHRVAVLAVDPSSRVSGGSILGDKSRMTRLSRHEDAFVRPSPAGRTLGGVARRTRESLLLCEAAGFDVVCVETVGVGQSETVVADMVDVFLVLMLPGGGDELQGIKRGILELADVVAVNKADGPQEALARTAVREYSAALRYLRPRSPHWRPRALAISGRTGAGLDELWALLGEHRAALEAAGALEELRREQRAGWMWACVEERLRELFAEHPAVRARLAETEDAVRAGTLPPTRAAMRLLEAFGLRAADAAGSGDAPRSAEPPSPESTP